MGRCIPCYGMLLELTGHKYHHCCWGAGNCRKSHFILERSFFCCAGHVSSCPIFEP